MVLVSERMDRNQIAFESFTEHEKNDSEYWKKTTIKERLQTVTFLRECLYGPEATTGRLQRFFEFLKLQ